MPMRHEVIESGAQRCDAAPSQLVNEIMTPTVTAHLSSETQLKDVESFTILTLQPSMFV